MKLKNLLLKLSLYSFVVIPFDQGKWLDLNYSKLKNNKVNRAEKTLTIEVNETASPLFFVFPQKQKITKIHLKGKLTIEKALNGEEDDAYFQLALISTGDYNPGGMATWFLPKWLKTLFELGGDQGLGDIHFFGVYEEGKRRPEKIQEVKEIKLIFKDEVKLDSQGLFQFNLSVPEKEYFGMWFRADGDDSKAKFKLSFQELKYLP